MPSSEPQAAAPKPPARPLPLQENHGLTDPFWQAARRHVLLVQHCRACAAFIHFPREQCPQCFSKDLEWQEVSGRGRVYSFTHVYQPQHPGFREDTPYCVAVVQLKEGPRMLSNLIGVPLHEVRCDMPVVVAFDDVTPEWTLVKFRPDDTAT
jgi:uncharacterized OB-fold protein